MFFAPHGFRRVLRLVSCWDFMAFEVCGNSKHRVFLPPHREIKRRHGTVFALSVLHGMSTKRILLVHDDRLLTNLYREKLEGSGFAVDSTRNLDQVAKLIESKSTYREQDRLDVLRLEALEASS